MPLSDDFKKKLLEPIDALFEEAKGGDESPSSGRNLQGAIPTIWGGSPSGEALREKSALPSVRKRKWTVDEEALASVLMDLARLVGQEEVKASLSRLVDLVRISLERKRARLWTPMPSCHMVFTGSPGTGKTTVARLVGRILRSLGILEMGHLVEVDKSGLVAEFLGQTPKKTNEVIDDALGGVLFIDEAYALYDDKEDLYGREAVSTILKRMEDDRGKFVVIVAGYSKKMERFISSNPGLSSRFSRFVEFSDYSVDEMQAIFTRMFDDSSFAITPGLLFRSEKTWDVLQKEGDLSRGNARFARTAFELILENQAVRLRREVGTLGKTRLSSFDPRDWDGVEKSLKGGSLCLEEKWDADL